MSVHKRRLTPEEISSAFHGKAGDEFPVILSPTSLAQLLRLSPKTIYHWLAQGRLDGAYRRRGKHVLIWRDRAIDIIFNDTDWS